MSFALSRLPSFDEEGFCDQLSYNLLVNFGHWRRHAVDNFGPWRRHAPNNSGPWRRHRSCYVKKSPTVNEPNLLRSKSLKSGIINGGSGCTSALAEPILPLRPERDLATSQVLLDTRVVGFHDSKRHLLLRSRHATMRCACQEKSKKLLPHDDSKSKKKTENT